MIRLNFKECQHILSMNETHFLVNLLLNHADMTQNPINEKIILKVFDCLVSTKQKQSFYVEILKQFHFRNDFLEKKGWLVEAVREKVKSYFRKI